MSKKKLIPELRFPEFVNEGEWLECSIESIGDVVTGSTPTKNEAVFWGGDFVWATAQDFKEKYIWSSVQKLTNNGKGKTRVIPKNSVLVTCIASIGLNAINKVECATNQQINSIICNSDNHFEFVYYSIFQNGNRLKNLAGRTAVPIISKSVFEKFNIQKPKSSKEQQKIASCLSSLDEVIGAHSQKLELLKAHKNGLMQNLFPQEGEKVPKLRFKEFEIDGEWEEEALGEICDVRDGTHDSPTYVTEGYPLITSKNLLINGSMDFENVSYLTEEDYNQINKRSKVDIGDILFGMIGTIGNPVIVRKDGFAIKNVALIKSIGKLNQDFLLHQLNCNLILSQFEKVNAGGILKFIALGVIRNLTILVPSPIEQKKIASCLSSLDDLITAQTEKIEQLKLHKKGLMQGLFPRLTD